MQLLLILGIVFAIGAVAFALQNSLPVTVAVASWHFDSSLAIVLLAALGLGALIAGLVSTPSVIKGQWASARLQRQVAILEDDKAALERRIHELESRMKQESFTPVPGTEEVPPYVGLKALVMAHEEGRAR